MTGTVFSYQPKRRFGFIEGDDRRDYFFHASEVVGDMLAANDRVDFEFVEQPGKRPRALSVRRVGIRPVVNAGNVS